MVLTEQNRLDIMQKYQSTAINNEQLAEEYQVSQETIRQVTSGLTKDPKEEAASEDALDKAEIAHRLQLLSALKEEGVTAKEMAAGFKKLINSADNQDVKFALAELDKIMGAYARDKSTGSGAAGSGIIDKRYSAVVVKLPKRNDKAT